MQANVDASDPLFLRCLHSLIKGSFLLPLSTRSNTAASIVTDRVLDAEGLDEFREVIGSLVGRHHLQPLARASGRALLGISQWLQLACHEACNMGTFVST